MNKYKIILILSFTLLIVACGNNLTISTPGQTQANGMFEALTLSGNQLYIKTKEQMNVRFEYYDRINNSAKYMAWSAKEKDTEFLFHLPVSAPNKQYSMKIRIENEKVYQDTLIQFTTASNNYNFLEMHYIDVAQGDGIYIKTPEGKNIMVDGGYGSRGDATLNWQGYGEPLALDYVNTLGISHFNYLIETHRHADHYGGLYDIRDSGDYTYDYYLSTSNSYNYQVGQNLFLDSAVQFKVLNMGYPPDQNTSGANNSSIVLKLTYYNAEILLTGDAEGVVQNYMMANSWSLSADVLKIAHHGSSSNGTSSLEFLQNVLNQYAKVGILSFGTNNSYGHPHAVYRFASYDIFGTGNPSSASGYVTHHFNQGTIKTYTDGQGIFVLYQ